VTAVTHTAERRIAATFKAATVDGATRKLLIPFITAGDPDLDTSLALMHTLVEAGADVIELGVPFSDPMADGPVIQAASERALKNGVSLKQVIDLVARFRESNDDTPVVLMGYMNPVETLGYAEFAKRASAAGVDGVLTVDLPPEEASDLVAELDNVGLDAIFLLSPTSPDERVREVCQTVSGYIYYVSLKGITGAGNLDTSAVANKVAHIKSMSDIPIAVGFGIKDAESAAAISKMADAVIVGSALVALVAEHGDDSDQLHKAMHAKVNSMREAMDAGLTASRSA